MLRLKRFGACCVIAIVMAGGLAVAVPADAGTAPPAVCARLALSIQTLTDLAARYPDSRLLAYLLEHAQAIYAEYCS
jgi:hypothetical protein